MIQGKTPFIWAAKLHHGMCMQLLVVAGADIYAEDNSVSGVGMYISQSRMGGVT